MKTGKIAIIGGGNLGGAIATGLVHTKAVEASSLHVTRRRPQLLEPLAKMGIVTGSNNLEAAKDADILFLAVKPYQIEDVISEVSSELSSSTIIISLAAGLNNQTLFELTGGKYPVFRAMPNTAVAIGESMTGISGINASKEDIEIVKALFAKLGSVEVIPEDLMDGITVLASCGIAFALRFIRAATEAGVEIGFGSELALKVVSQTVKGAARLLIEGGGHPEAEIDKVTTPRGITIAGLNEMEHGGFSSSVIKAIKASFEKTENSRK
jgi:pyrroline-5-carboxylate reductase